MNNDAKSNFFFLQNKFFRKTRGIQYLFTQPAGSLTGSTISKNKNFNTKAEYWGGGVKKRLTSR